MPLIQQVRGRLQGRCRGGRSRASRWRSSTSRPSRRTSPASTTRPRARPRRPACTTTAPTSSTRPPVVPAAASSRRPRPPSGLAIGVDSDQYNTADPSVKDVIMTSMLKRVDVAVFDFIEQRGRRCRSPAGPKVFDLKAGRRRLLHQRRLSTTSRPSSRTSRQQIIAGEITVPTKPRPKVTRRDSRLPDDRVEEALASPRTRSSFRSPIEEGVAILPPLPSQTRGLAARRDR